MKKFLSRLIKENIHVSIVDGQLSVKIPNKGVDASLIEEIKSRKQDLIDYIDNLKKLNDNAYEDIQKVPEAESYPISNAQHRLWILNQFESQAKAYNIFTHIELNGDYDIRSFKKAIHAVIDRHEILRTVFKEVSTGEIRQFIIPSQDFDFVIDYKDYRALKKPKEASLSYIEKDSYKSFDLENGPLLRAALLHLEDNSYVFHLNMHHIISDDWSLGVLSQDVMRYHEAFSSEITPDIPELKIQYKDYSAWQFNRADGQGYKESKEYWLERLSGEIPRIDLPTPKLRPKFKTSNGRYLSTFISKDLTNQMYEFIKLHQGSLFMLTLAMINVLIYRYTSIVDMVIGSPVAGRIHVDLEDQIGFYVNVIALRNKIVPEDNFIHFYNALRDNTIKDFEHQEYPYDSLIESLGLGFDAGRASLYDITLTFYDNNTNLTSKEIDQNLDSKIKDRGFVANKNDLEFHFMPLDDMISFDIIFNNDIYSKQFVKKIMNDYKYLLQVFMSDSEKKIKSITNQSEKAQKIKNNNMSKLRQLRRA